MPGGFHIEALSKLLLMIREKRRWKIPRHHATNSVLFCQTGDEPSGDVSQKGEKEREGDLGVIGRKGACGCWEEYHGVTETEGGGRGQNSVSLKVMEK